MGASDSFENPQAISNLGWLALAIHSPLNQQINALSKSSLLIIHVKKIKIWLWFNHLRYEEVIDPIF